METVQQASFETPSNSRIDRNSFRAVPSNSHSQVNNEDDYISEEEAKKRRELLERRPSYRKILSDLSESERDLVKKEVGEALQLPARTATSCANSGKAGTSGVNSVIGSPPLLGHLISGRPDVTLGYAGTSASDSELNFGGLNTPSLSTAALIHYASQQGQDNSGNLLIPFGLKMSHNVMSSAHSSDSPGSSPLVSPSLEMNSPSGNHGMPDEANRKRELRLMKNREAAKECRRKKKEYVRCLEGRVAVLENQNKALIEELKTLKELYCRKAE